MARPTALRGHDQIVVTVAAIDQRCLPLPARAPPRRSQDQGLCALPVMTLLTAGREIALDVLLPKESGSGAEVALVPPDLS